MPDQMMLVLHVAIRSCQLCRLTSMPLHFQFKEPPLAHGIPKSQPWYRYGYFLESLIASDVGTGKSENRPFSSCLPPLCQNESLRNHSYGNVCHLDVHVHFHANQTHFHMKGLAQ